MRVLKKVVITLFLHGILMNGLIAEMPPTEAFPSSGIKISVQVMKRVPTSIYHLFKKMGLSLAKYTIVNNTDKVRTFYVKTRIIGFSSNIVSPIELVMYPGTKKELTESPIISPDNYSHLGVLREDVFVETLVSSDREMKNIINKGKTRHPVTLYPYDTFVWKIVDADGAEYNGHENPQFFYPLLVAWVDVFCEDLDEIGIIKEDGTPTPIIGRQSVEKFKAEFHLDISNQVKYIYNAVQGRATYNESSFGHEESVQQIRHISQTLKSKKANCIDATILFCSLLLKGDFNPIIICDDKHALPGWYDQEKKQYSALETVGMSGHTFEEAVKIGMRRIAALGLSKEFKNDSDLRKKLRENNGLFIDGNVRIIDVKHQFRENKIWPTPITVSGGIKSEREEEVENLLLQWQKAWEEQDIEKYIRCYSTSNFKGAIVNIDMRKEVGFDEWRKYKKRLFDNYHLISIEKNRPRIYFPDKQTAEVSFLQKFSSDRYTDFGYKYLTLKKIAGTWEIIREDFELR